jgi:AmmeMemoRadiSam system protein A
MEDLLYMRFSDMDKKAMLTVARDSICEGLKTHTLKKPNLEQYSDLLTKHLASFVTLEKDENLRGCIGSLQATEPLIENISKNAFNAAFKDHRFSPVIEKELSSLKISISVLSEPVEMSFESEEALLNQLKVGVDGLILEEQGLRATFLPSVWQHLPKKHEFIEHLKQKAGLPKHYWSKSIRVHRYHTDYIQEQGFYQY